MRAIPKGAEPTALRAYRATPGAVFDGANFTPVKTEIRAALLRDQLWVCAYCMGRIVPDEQAHPTRPDGRPVPAMKVEHWQPRSRYPSLGLSWTNLLGVCLGGIGKAPSEQTCDARKGDAEIALNPLDAAHVATLHCTSNGRLTSTDPRFQSDLEDRLGLNHRVLVEGRRALLDRELSRLGAAHPRGSLSPGALRAAVGTLEKARGGQLCEFGGVLRLWARKARKRHGETW
jgi:uncharacterized protein (TIGR02646 family)